MTLSGKILAMARKKAKIYQIPYEVVLEQLIKELINEPSKTFHGGISK